MKDVKAHTRRMTSLLLRGNCGSSMEGGGGDGNGGCGGGASE
jgi:hypothetical protein